MNVVGISGTLGKPLTLTRLDEETVVLNNTVKVFRHPKLEKFDWVNILAYDETAEYMVQNFKEGDFVSIQGSLRTRSWTKEGEDKKNFITEVLVYQIE